MAGYLTVADSTGGDRSGLTEDRIETVAPELEKYVRSAMERADVPAVAVGIVANDRLVYTRGFGTGEQGQAIDAETMFEIGSATKPFLGATLAILADRGELSWDDRVIDHYPEFKLADPWVTREFRVADLLAQRSGMSPYAADVLSLLGYPPSDSIAAFARLKAETSFRSEFAYQNVPHQIASRIVAEKTGNPDWNAAVAELLLNPLGMNSSGTSGSLLTDSSDSTRGHQIQDGELRKVQPVSLPERVYGAGSIVSNVADMARWIRFQLGRGQLGDRRLLDRKQHGETWKPRVPVSGEFADRMEQVPGATHLSYGTGWFLHSVPEGRIVEHGGTTLGYTSAVRLDPDRGFGIVVLTNQSHDGGIAIPISKYAFDLLQGREPRDPLGDGPDEAVAAGETAEKDAREEPARRNRVRGTWVHPVAGRMRIVERDGELWTRLGPKRIDARLEVDDVPFELSWHVDNAGDGPVMSAPVIPRLVDGRIESLQVADLAFKRVR